MNQIKKIFKVKIRVRVLIEFLFFLIYSRRINLNFYNSIEIIEIFRDINKLTTTIQIDDETKEKLFYLKLDLEKQRGKPISYNDLIMYLLKNQYRNINRAKYLKEFKNLKGSLPKDTLKMYLDDKRKELEREEKMAPLNNK